MTTRWHSFEGEAHWLVVRDKPATVHAMMHALAGNAHLSLEGDLSQCKLASVPNVSYEERHPLSRATLWPRQDFAVIPLEPEILPAIWAAIQNGGISHRIIHMQIEKNGKLEFGAYDNFHEECVVSGPAITAPFLEELRSKHILRSFEAAKPQSS
jgi:hypothetical protein